MATHRLQIAMVASEAVPFAKVGGLADVMGALPVHLEQLGASVSVIIPRHGSIDLRQLGFEPYPVEMPPIPLGFDQVTCDVHRGKLPGSNVPVFLLGNDRFFN